MKSAACPMPGTPEEIHKVNYPKPSNYYGIEAEEYLNLTFGPGTWVLDSAEDKYVVLVGGTLAGERSYVVVDRQWRRYPVTVPASSRN